MNPSTKFGKEIPSRNLREKVRKFGLVERNNELGAKLGHPLSVDDRWRNKVPNAQARMSGFVSTGLGSHS